VQQSIATHFSGIFLDRSKVTPPARPPDRLPADCGLLCRGAGLGAAGSALALASASADAAWAVMRLLACPWAGWGATSLLITHG
jgi:hypothetical protein